MEFIPSKQQIELLNAMLDIDVPSTVTAICEHVGISRTTYYEWFKNDDFVEWFNREHRIHTTQYIVMLDKIGLSKASEDYRYWEAMQTKYGGYAKYKKLEPSIFD